MKPIHFVFFMLLVIAGITLYILTSDVPEGATGVAHPSIRGLSIGGDAEAVRQSIGHAPYYFQIAVILLAGSLLYMGIPEHRRDGLLRLFFVCGISFGLIVWSALYFGYVAFTETGETSVFFGFPVPTNLFFWGVWATFALFDFFYALAFYRYILHPEDEAAFEALVADMKHNDGQAKGEGA